MLNSVSDHEVQQYHELAGNELICNIRKTPTVLYGIFTELVQQFWKTDSSCRLFGTPDIVWNKDPSKTGIWVDTEFRWEATHPEFRPAIYVKLSPIQYGTVDGNTTGLIRRDLEEGEFHYARTGSGQVTFVHIAATDGEACTLADATMDYLDAFSPVITDDFCFDWFKIAAREPLRVADRDSNKKYGSTVSYDFRFTDSWSLKRETPKLRNLVVSVSEAIADSIETREYRDFKPADGGLGLPHGLTRQVKNE